MTFERIIKIVLAFLFFLCLLDMPYGYYELVRFLGMIGFGVLAFENYQKSQTWFIVWLSSAVLINPFLKIALGRDLWNVIDVIWALLLVSSIFIRKRN
jgi:hypothetical protein